MRRAWWIVPVVAFVALAALGRQGLPRAQGQGRYRLLAWSDRGIVEPDADYGVYAMKPPGDNLRAQLVDPTAHLVRDNAGVTLSYEAVADPSGSRNATSIGKSTFWDHAQALLGRPVPADTGLGGARMPGVANQPQPLKADAATRRWFADGIPILPWDDAGRRQTYPVLRVKARDAAGAELASADVVLPVSDETDCRSCHGSNTMGAARPEDGWVNEADTERDYRLNVLRRHDDRHRGDAVYTAGLAAAGYLAGGLYATVVTTGRPVLCTACHAGEPGTGGRPDTSSLSRAMHFRHGTVTDPATGKTMNSATDRASCFRCHAGAQTQHLRGAMGRAVAADGSLAIQCQSCHGSMRDVGSRDRKPWQNLPDCQSCHTGHAMANAGEIRYSSSFLADGTVRQAVDPIFATNANAPSAGLSLYSASKGHGSLACAACHGSTHAEFYPGQQGNDRLMAVGAQGHAGSIAECSACHAANLNSVNGGPHQMHSIGQIWIGGHKRSAEQNPETCRTCHGADYRGTVLSQMLAARRMTGEGKTFDYWRGFQVGCYNCHDGPRTERPIDNRAAQVQDAILSTSVDTPVAVDLSASDGDGDSLTLRIVDQPAHGTVGLAGRKATYFPAPGFQGQDQFSFAAWDGKTDSNLGKVLVTVNGGVPSPTATARPTFTPRSGATVEATPTAVQPSATPQPTGASATPTPRPDGKTPTPGTRHSLHIPWLQRTTR